MMLELQQTPAEAGGQRQRGGCNDGRVVAGKFCHYRLAQALLIRLSWGVELVNPGNSPFVFWD